MPVLTPGGNNRFGRIKAGPQIHACRLAGGGSKKIVLPLGIEFTRAGAHKRNVHGGHALVEVVCLFGGVLLCLVVVHRLLLAQLFVGGKSRIGAQPC